VKRVQAYMEKATREAKERQARFETPSGVESKRLYTGADARDELDALGARRAQQVGTFRVLVNQLLDEMDGVARAPGDESRFILAASNHPWDVDPAFPRPGRLDQSVFVPPPDERARAAVLRGALAGRPVERIDLVALARATEGFSSADLVRASPDWHVTFEGNGVLVAERVAS